MWKLGALWLVWIVMRERYGAYLDLTQAKAKPAAGDEDDTDKVKAPTQSLWEQFLGTTPPPEKAN
jgi:hypothetical protein